MSKDLDLASAMVLVGWYQDRYKIAIDALREITEMEADQPRAAIRAANAIVKMADLPRESTEAYTR